MRRTRSLPLTSLLILLMAGSAAAQDPAGEGEIAIGEAAREALTLTVYNQNLALVTETRSVTFDEGLNRLAILDVSRQLQPETVILSGENLALVEQGFDADLLNQQRLLDRYLGETVWVRREGDEGEPTYVQGRLVSIAGQPLVEIEGRLETVPFEQIVFPAEGISEGYRDRPTLFATLESGAAGRRDLGISYLTGGLSWQADYVARLDPKADSLDLSALVTLRNDSGTDFNDARLRLVAGQVNQEGPRPYQGKAERMEMMASAPMPAADSVQQQAVGDQHLYSLERPLDLADRQSKQVGLLSVASVPVERDYRFENLIAAHGGPEEIGPAKAQIRLEIANDEAGGLGRPLPEGTVRVYQGEAEGEAELGAPVFLGEARIGHTAAGETLKLTLGTAFDITGKATRTHYERISDRAFETGQEIEVENAKAEPVTVSVVGHLPQGWKMIEESLAHEKETASRVVWKLQVPAGGKASFTYKIRVTQP